MCTVLEVVKVIAAMLVALGFLGLLAFGLYLASHEK
jgi:hypothetical protein